MSESNVLLAQPPKAFLTDVFGTVVNWRKSVTEHLQERAQSTLNSPAASIPSTVRLTVADVSWSEFAQKWHRSYIKFSNSYDPATMPFKPIEQHHRESLQELIREYNLVGLWQDDEIEDICLIWHQLEAWPDSAPGLKRLNENFTTATLSNGSIKLLSSLAAINDLAYTKIFSAESFQAYKPHPRTYLGAAEHLQLKPSECCLIAAHLPDLQAAKQYGYKTIYIERPLEETWSAEQIEQAKQDGFVDMWISSDQEGFKAVAELFVPSKA